jgi:antitoxin ParD1/3/4
MSQDTMNIALPEAMKQFVLAQVSAGGYSTASEYVSELIRADQKRKSQARLESFLLEGLDSGKATAITKAGFESIRSEVAVRLKKRRKK